MSEKVRKRAGIIAVLLSLALCSVPSLFSGRNQLIIYQAGNHVSWRIKPVLCENRGMISVNTADAEELTEIPGVGETISSLIIAEREKNGPFFYPEDLIAVHGIGPVTISKIRDLINLRIN